MDDKPPLPPFTQASATLKVGLAADAWNTRDPGRAGYNRFLVLPTALAVHLPAIYHAKVARSPPHSETPDFNSASRDDLARNAHGRGRTCRGHRPFSIFSLIDRSWL
jgi:hypothetical protein